MPKTARRKSSRRSGTRRRMRGGVSAWESALKVYGSEPVRSSPSDSTIAMKQITGGKKRRSTKGRRGSKRH